MDARESIMNDVLSQRRDNVALLTRMVQRQEDLLDCSEDMEGVEFFFKSQRSVYDEARRQMDRVNKERDYFASDADVLDVFHTIATILAQPKPYDRIGELPELIQKVKAAYSGLLDLKKDEVAENIRQCMQDVHQLATEARDAGVLLRQADDYFVGKREAAKNAFSLTELDAMITQLLTYKDNICRRMEVMSASHQEATTQGGTGTAQPALKMPKITTLLLPNNILKQDSVLGHMVADIPEADWTDQVQIIGWLYQYYNSELKDDTFALLKKNGSQNITGNNEKYLRYHWEVESDKVGQTYWVFYAKGGDYRKYYGNLEMVIDWRDSARNFYATNKTSNLLSEHFWFREGVTYSAVTSRGTGFRYLPKGCIFDKGGPSIAIKDNLYYLLALLNSKTAELYFRVLNPSINLQVKDIKALPILVEDKDKIADITQRSVQLAKDDWDSFETSYTFKRHPLTVGHTRVEDAFAAWKAVQLERFDELLSNETTVNELFKAIYRLDDLEIKFEERDIPIRKAILQRDIHSLISYAVGCMFGRYSLDEPGLVCAGGNWDPSKYCTYVPDSDNIIPICDDDYFDDDITGRFVKWVETVYGTRASGYGPKSAAVSQSGGQAAGHVGRDPGKAHPCDRIRLCRYLSPAAHEFGCPGGHAHVYYISLSGGCIWQSNLYPSV